MDVHLWSGVRPIVVPDAQSRIRRLVPLDRVEVFEDRIRPGGRGSSAMPVAPDLIRRHGLHEMTMTATLVSAAGAVQAGSAAELEGHARHGKPWPGATACRACDCTGPVDRPAESGEEARQRVMEPGARRESSADATRGRCVHAHDGMAARAKGREPRAGGWRSMRGCWCRFRDARNARWTGCHTGDAAMHGHPARSDAERFRARRAACRGVRRTSGDAPRRRFFIARPVACAARRRTPDPSRRACSCARRCVRRRRAARSCSND
ncbi:hypothetical protein DM82_5664 [Burkholderia oklahomensis]|uniref:Uncharacterized protein n=1 Tax=Burkholderia oklahomensis TaxID=342113 RepID=A0AAI8FRC7_9BURK|nr:hypothetical protein DM82_5664 [Burkholderia oklahomensis]